MFFVLLKIDDFSAAAGDHSQFSNGRALHTGNRALESFHQVLFAWIIFIAELIRAETSVMLLGTMSVVLESLATSE